MDENIKSNSVIILVVLPHQNATDQFYNIKQKFFFSASSENSYLWDNISDIGSTISLICNITSQLQLQCQKQTQAQRH